MCSQSEEIARILAMKQGKSGTKLILVLLTLHPEGLTIYQIMDLLGTPPTSRKCIQRQLEWPVATGQIRQSHKGQRGGVNKPIIYTKPTGDGTHEHTDPRPQLPR